LKEEAPTHPEADVTTLAMPPASVIQAIIEAMQAPLSGVKYMAVSCAHIPGSRNTYPLWIVSYWAELGPVRESQKCWNGVIHALEEQIRKDESSDPLTEQVLDRILALPWYSGLRGFYEANVEGLVRLCKPGMLIALGLDTCPSSFGLSSLIAEPTLVYPLSRILVFQHYLVVCLSVQELESTSSEEERFSWGLVRGGDTKCYGLRRYVKCKRGGPGEWKAKICNFRKICSEWNSYCQGNSTRP
jgi:hypothetical protein